MLYKLKDCKNGFYMDESTTEEEFNTILKRGYGLHNVRCIICNSKMAKVIKFKIAGKSRVTINNNVEDQKFFVNSKC